MNTQHTKSLIIRPLRLVIHCIRRLMTPRVLGIKIQTWFTTFGICLLVYNLRFDFMFKTTCKCQ